MRADTEFHWKQVGMARPVSEGEVPGDVRRGQGRAEDIGQLGAEMVLTTLIGTV